jgi:hypothetical protein
MLSVKPVARIHGSPQPNLAKVSHAQSLMEPLLFPVSTVRSERLSNVIKQLITNRSLFTPFRYTQSPCHPSRFQKRGTPDRPVNSPPPVIASSFCSSNRQPFGHQVLAEFPKWPTPWALNLMIGMASKSFLPGLHPYSTEVNKMNGWAEGFLIGAGIILLVTLFTAVPFY